MRLLTVHGAKGLEAPIVWVVDAAGNRERVDTCAPLVDWPPEAGAPSHFSLFTSRAQIGPHREPIAAREDAAARRERLNLLYVALTRASQYFFASGVMPRGAIEETDYGRLRRALTALAGEDHALGWGEFALAAPVPGGEAPAQPRLRLFAPTPAVGARRTEPAASERVEFGLQLHAWLEAATVPGAARPEVGEAVRRTGERILAAPDLQRFFVPAHYERAANEVPFVRADGTSGRIDRLVWREDGLWIVDYKSGGGAGERLDQHRSQLDDYRAALATIWPGRAIHCVLVFGDASHLSW